MKQDINLFKCRLNDSMQELTNIGGIEQYVSQCCGKVEEIILKEDYENHYQSMNIDSYKRCEQLYEASVAGRYLIVVIDGQIHSTPIRFIDWDSVCYSLNFYKDKGHSVKVFTIKIKD